MGSELFLRFPVTLAKGVFQSSSTRSIPAEWSTLTCTHEDEFSYILEGEIGAWIGDEMLQATTGSYVFKPRGLPHTFWNATAKPARLLELISPAGFEKYFAELADLLRTGGGVDQITNLAERYGMELRMDWVPELCAKFKLKPCGRIGLRLCAISSCFGILWYQLSR